jgi:predicted metal-dependent enzyme (double-stranded beta helix superfamily)
MTVVTTTSDTERRNASLVSPAIPSPTSGALAPRQLASIAQQLAAQADVWRPILHFDPDDRWYTRLTVGEGWEAWLLTWLPGQHTDLHDHGGSSGAFTVLEGELEELTPAPPGADPARPASRTLRSPAVRAFGPRHIHQVTGVGGTPAVSLHVYGPALTVMNRYELDAERGPVLAVTERAGLNW